MKRSFPLVLCLLILGTLVQPASSAEPNSTITLSCPSGLRPVFNAPIPVSVLVRDRFGSPVTGEPVFLSISGPGAFDPGLPALTNNLGVIDAIILPTPGSQPQSIRVTASIQAGVVVSTSCEIASSVLRPSDVIVRLDGPESVVSGSTLILKLQLTTREMKAIPGVPITWTVVGPGLPFPSRFSDQDGSAILQHLLLPGDAGVLTVTATSNMGSFTHTIYKTIRVTTTALPAPPAPDIEVQFLTSDSFANITILNAKGAVVSIKFGSRWIRVLATADVFLQRIQATAEVVPVVVYVNGQLESVATLNFPEGPKPTTTPSPKPAATEPTKRVSKAQPRTIICKSGPKWMKVTTLNPNCFGGYKATSLKFPTAVQSVRCSKPGTSLTLVPSQVSCPPGFRRG